MRSAPNTSSGRKAPQAPRDLDHVSAPMTPSHPLEHEIVPGLHREMQMRHEARLVGDEVAEIAIDRRRIERGEPQATQLRHRIEQAAQQPAEARPIRQIVAVRGEIHAGDDEFHIAAGDQRPGLRHDRRQQHAAAWAAAERDHAEGAPVIAALLNLKDGPRAPLQTCHRAGRDARRCHDVADQQPRRGVVGRQRPPRLGPKLFGITDDVVDFRHGGVGAAGDLRAAAGDDDPCGGTVTADAPDRLPRLPFGLGGHGATVHDHGVGHRSRGRMTLDHRRFEGVQPATERDHLNPGVRWHRRAVRVSASRRIPWPSARSWSPSPHRARRSPARLRPG